MPVKKNTLARILNANGFFWKAVPKTMRLTKQEVDKRKVWVQKYGGKPASWWGANMNLVLDGVTLSVPPKTLSGRQKHAAQRIGHMWMRKGEQVDSTLHTCNRYGVQLGTKVPLWGGFTGGGQFTLRLWTPRPKMLKTEWQKLVPALNRAVDTAESRAQERNTKRAKVWHDNEKFLLCPATYRTNGLELVRFPPEQRRLEPHRDCLGRAAQGHRRAGAGGLGRWPGPQRAAVQAARGPDLERMERSQDGRDAQFFVSKSSCAECRNGWPSASRIAMGGAASELGGGCQQVNYRCQLMRNTFNCERSRQGRTHS